jgi:hypothetical protein
VHEFNSQKEIENNVEKKNGEIWEDSEKAVLICLGSDLVPSTCKSIALDLGTAGKCTLWPKILP